MAKKHLQSAAEQITEKGHGAAPFHYEKAYNQTNESVKSGNIQMKVPGDASSVQTLAYQIYQQKGGSELDNWLEAERILGNNGQAVNILINEGDPNIQK
jgi:hypothetical protein